MGSTRTSRTPPSRPRTPSKRPDPLGAFSLASFRSGFSEWQQLSQAILSVQSLFEVFAAFLNLLLERCLLHRAILFEHERLVLRSSTPYDSRCSFHFVFNSCILQHF